MTEKIDIFFARDRHTLEAEITPRVSAGLSEFLPVEIVEELEGEIPWPCRCLRMTGKFSDPRPEVINRLRSSANCAVFIGAWRYRLTAGADDGSFDATDWRPPEQG